MKKKIRNKKKKIWSTNDDRDIKNIKERQTGLQQKNPSSKALLNITSRI